MSRQPAWFLIALIGFVGCQSSDASRKPLVVNGGSVACGVQVWNSVPRPARVTVFVVNLDDEGVYPVAEGLEIPAASSSPDPSLGSDPGPVVNIPFFVPFGRWKVVLLEIESQRMAEALLTPPAQSWLIAWAGGPEISTVLDSGPRGLE